jgi:hypothetical protein
MEQRMPGTLQVWAEPFTPLRVPKFFDLRADPYERADITSNTYWGLDGRPRLHHVRGPGGGGQVPCDLQGVSAEPATGHVHHRPGDGEAAAEHRAQLTVRTAPADLPAGTGDGAGPAGWVVVQMKDGWRTIVAEALR